MFMTSCCLATSGHDPKTHREEWPLADTCTCLHDHERREVREVGGGGGEGGREGGRVRGCGE